jgi:polysaccharide deacetylase 2 family uncharacterized protein YibQ
MNLIQKLKPKFAFLSSSKMWLTGIFVLAAFLVIILISKTYLGQQGRVEQALLSGQRLEVSIETGQVNGKIATSAVQPETAAAAPQTPDVKSPPAASVPTESAAPDAAAPEKQPEDELAWMDTEFIGPPMQQELLDILRGNSDSDTQNQLEVKKVTVSELGEKPVIILIIKGLGLSASSTEEAMDLPKNVTLGFSPYSPSLADWVAKAKAAGHEILLNIPMETKDFNLNDPGPYALATKATKEDNVTRLKMILALTDGYQAVYSDNEEVFTHSIISVTPVLQSLKHQGKYFIFGGGYDDFSLVQVAEGMNYPILVNDVLLDKEISPEGINKKFTEIETIAKSRGFVVVMAHPYPITVRMLERWLPESEKRGFAIMPVSTLLGKSFLDKKQ